MHRKRALSAQICHLFTSQGQYFAESIENCGRLKLVNKNDKKKQIKVGEDTHIDLLFVSFTPTAKCFLFSTPVMLPSILTGGVQHIVFKVPLHRKEEKTSPAPGTEIL